MSTQENIQIVKNAFTAIGRGDKQGLLALSAEDIEWIIPGKLTNIREFIDTLALARASEMPASPRP